jgi:hypothetical protein
VTCGFFALVLTARARRESAVPDAVRTQHGPGHHMLVYGGDGSQLGRRVRHVLGGHCSHGQAVGGGAAAS